MTAIPAHIEKTLAKLKTQMEKAKIEGTYHVSSQGIIYSLENQSQILTIGSLQRKTDSQILRRKSNTFLDDLRQSKDSTRQPEVPLGDTWEEKITHICQHINSTHSGQAAQLKNKI
ncbi:hypothetical protein F8M41_000763 [Gigaspora margarita]|uniref:Uncharacterized protein n=1 Tax=Gigaspora margarita TaxID=4874 RepID=A0A8H4AZA7_GIGMA|nr:hypothetical protein F8M41_000763 [Gigaspora margarita]